jgi:glycosyltransferase involved in cell wall biosynthesis
MSGAELDLSLVILVSDPRPDPAVLRATIDAWRPVLEGSGRSHEVIVVDDGHGGELAQAAASARGEWPAVRILQFRRRFGESVALDAAVEHARGRYIATTTWYVQVDPAGLLEAMRRLDAGADFVAGRRTDRVDGAMARLPSFLFNAYTRWLTGVRLHDLNCTFRAFRREIAQELHVHGDLFRFLSVLAVQRGFRVEEIPLRHLREEGRPIFFSPGAYVRRFLDILSLFFLIKFTHKPLRFFGLLGVGFGSVGAVICLWMLHVRFIQNQALADKPLLVLGIFLVVLGFIVAGIGLIGEIIIFTQGRSLRDYHVDRIIEGPEEAEVRT